MTRIVVYLDGSNLHNRLKEAGRSMYPAAAADLYRLAQELCSVTPDDTGKALGGTLVDVLYCNAPIKVPSGQPNHLQVFMNRLGADSRFRLRQGTRKDSPLRCPHRPCAQEILDCPYCRSVMRRRTVEKGVDLQIAAECVADAAAGHFDIALVFTHDEDYSQLVRVLWDRLRKDVRIAYHATGRNRRPITLINSTQNRQGLDITKAPSYPAVFPAWSRPGGTGS